VHTELSGESQRQSLADPAWPATVDAQIQTPAVHALLAQYDGAHPPDAVTRSGVWRVELTLDRRCRELRGCYVEHWWPDRFELLGELFVIPADESLRMRGGGGAPSRSVICRIEPATIRDRLGCEPRWDSRQLQASLDIHNLHIHQLMLRLSEELAAPGVRSHVLVEAIGTQLMIELARHQSALVERSQRGGLAAWRLRLIDERIGQLERAPSLAELALLCGLSVRQLTRGFRATRGVSIGDYLERSRLHHARLLLNGQHSIKFIAAKMGLTASAFSFAFRRATGETPNQYRSRVRRCSSTLRVGSAPQIAASV
jgi:AraC family transcriptional regulator